MQAYSVSELCERAGVSRSTFYRHRDTLEALDLLRETEAGWRLALPHHGTADDETAERHETILPWRANPEENAGEWVVDVLRKWSNTWSSRSHGGRHQAIRSRMPSGARAIPRTSHA